MNNSKRTGMSPEVKRNMLQSLKSQIDSFDNKASIILATLGILIGLSTELFNGFSSFGSDCWTSHLFVAFFCVSVVYAIFSCLCVAFALLAIFPRGRMYNNKKIEAGKQNIDNFDLNYYMHIASDPERFKKEVKVYDENDEILDRQIIENAKICKRKHFFLRNTIIAMVPFGIFYIALFILSVTSIVIK